jgi:Methyltransferase FkbM domain
MVLRSQNEKRWGCDSDQNATETTTTSMPTKCFRLNCRNSITNVICGAFIVSILHLQLETSMQLVPSRLTTTFMSSSMSTSTPTPTFSSPLKEMKNEFMLPPSVIQKDLYPQPTSSNDDTQQHQKLLRHETKKKSHSSPSSSLPRPLDPNIQKYTDRPVQHLNNNIYNVSLKSPFGVDIKMKYFSGISQTHDGLYPFENHLSWFEGPVTYTWLAITDDSRRHSNSQHPLTLSSSSSISTGSSNSLSNIIIDAGMNTGFYSLLSAVRGYNVWSFDVQLDCFDVASILFRKNRVQHRIRMFHAGVWDRPEMMNVTEGIDNQAERQSPLSHEWPRRTHQVPVLPLEEAILTGGGTAAPDIAMTGRVEKPSNIGMFNITLLKLDVEGAEIAALRGLSDQTLQRIQNIILECAPTRMARLGDAIRIAVQQYQRLVKPSTGNERNGFVPYMLHQPVEMTMEKRTNKQWLREQGLDLVAIHPLTHQPLYDDADSSKEDKKGESNNSSISSINDNALLWKVSDFTILLTNGPCRVGCNLLFTKELETGV